ncbi:MAG TPA: phosphatase PAP2 family protein, partial [Patescibacteria group bacterium]|nr:phosphatase PAP2 family protein [Patescibacteria group bacterium]
LFFGNLPTATLQNWLWNGSVQWYDFTLYLAYMMHFVFPLVLAVVIWKKFPKKYWNYMATYVVLMFSGFLTYLLFPAAPPWMASDLGYIEPISRVSSHVWFALGIQDFPSLYNEIAPNPVAAVPSLHAAFSVLFAVYVIKLFKSKWRFMAWLYPFMIIFGSVYMGEHYIIDAILGAFYALAAYRFTPFITRKLKIRQKFKKLDFGKAKRA